MFFLGVSILIVAEQAKYSYVFVESHYYSVIL